MSLASNLSLLLDNLDSLLCVGHAVEGVGCRGVFGRRSVKIIYTGYAPASCLALNFSFLFNNLNSLLCVGRAVEGVGCRGVFGRRSVKAIYTGYAAASRLASNVSFLLDNFDSLICVGHAVEGVGCRGVFGRRSAKTIYTGYAAASWLASNLSLLLANLLLLTPTLPPHSPTWFSPPPGQKRRNFFETCCRSQRSTGCPGYPLRPNNCEQTPDLAGTDHPVVTSPSTGIVSRRWKYV